MRKIARLNDGFRRTFIGGKVVVTAGVHRLPENVRAAALVRVTRFSEFTKDNDPHGEHDFGSFDVLLENRLLRREGRRRIGESGGPGEDLAGPYTDAVARILRRTVRPKFIEIEGKRYAWADILKLRREQREAVQPSQLTLFSLRDDSRPAAHKTASGRYESPTLFDVRPTGKGH